MDKRAVILLAGFAVIFLFFWPGKKTEPAGVTETEKINYLVIDKLFLRPPIIEVESNDEATIQAGLRRGVVRLVGTANPGEIGNCYIVGHSSDYPWATGDYVNIFARLPELAAGDEIKIGNNLEVFKYQVTETKIIEADDFSVLSQETMGQKLLTLQTSYPIGTAQKRFIVIAKSSE